MPLTEQPAAAALIAQVRAHLEAGGGAALVRESQERWKFRLAFYAPTGVGPGGVPTWEFLRNVETRIGASVWAEIVEAKIGVAGRGLYGQAVPAEQFKRWNERAASTGDER